MIWVGTFGKLPLGSMIRSMSGNHSARTRNCPRRRSNSGPSSPFSSPTNCCRPNVDRASWSTNESDHSGMRGKSADPPIRSFPNRQLAPAPVISTRSMSRPTLIPPFRPDHSRAPELKIGIAFRQSLRGASQPIPFSSLPSGLRRHGVPAESVNLISTGGGVAVSFGFRFKSILTFNVTVSFGAIT